MWISKHLCKRPSILNQHGLLRPLPYSPISILSLHYILAIAMFRNALVVLAAVAAVNAQATPTPSLDSCILGCLSSASGCSSYTDFSCVCTSSQFQNDARNCLQSKCSSADLQAALQLQAQECASYTTSGSSSATATSAPASSSAATSAAASSTGAVASGSSAASSAASEASSAASSAASAASSAVSSILSSGSAALSSIKSSGTSAASSASSSAASAANSSSAAMSSVALVGTKTLVAGVAIAAGVLAGAGLVL